MIPASTYLPSTSSRMVAASSIQGIGVQNLVSARHRGFSAVSGMELGPDVSNRCRASSLVRPFAIGFTEGLTATGAVTLGTSGINAGARFRLNQSVINAFFHGKFDDHRPSQRKIFARDFAFNDGVSADFPQINLV